MQYFHGSWEAALQAGRAMAVLWNFHPFCRKTQQKNGFLCPFEQLNSFRYHDDWLRNFLITSSLHHSMAGGHFLNSLTPNSLELGLTEWGD